MVVCTGASCNGFNQNGETAYGSLFVTSDPNPGPALIGHEAKHSDQYLIFGGLAFGGLDAIESARTGGNGCRNVFEQWAGLEAGRYQC